MGAKLPPQQPDNTTQTIIILAETNLVRLVYYPQKEKVIMSLGSISLSFKPLLLQRIATQMMKASLQLDRLLPSTLSAYKAEQDPPPRVLH